MTGWYAGTSIDGRPVLALNVDLDTYDERFGGRFIGRRFTVGRHGGGRKYWGVTYPDGTYTHTARTQAEAKLQAESWEPDAELVQLVDAESGQVDRPPTAASSASGAAAFDAAAVLSALIDAQTSDRAKRPDANWSMQVAGERQRRALNAIEALTNLRRQVVEAVEVALSEQVELARTNTNGSWNSNAATWTDVGIALGVTKQSAQSKYGSSG